MPAPKRDDAFLDGQTEWGCICALSAERWQSLIKLRCKFLVVLISNLTHLHAEANLDNDSCNYECELCQNGTVWDNDLGAFPTYASLGKRLS